MVTGANSKLTTINGQMLIGQQATAGNGSTLTIADSGLVQTKTLKFGFDAGSGGYIHMGVGGILAVLNDKTGGTPFASGGLFTTGGDGGQIRYNPSGDGTTWVNMTGATAGSDYTLVHHTSTHIINGQELNGYTVLTMLVPTTYDWDGGTLTGSSSLTVATINLTGGTVSNVLAGSGAVNMLSGTATLSGDNTYDGGTFISGGTLVATHSNSFGTGTITTPASGGDGTLSLSNDTATTWANDFEIQSNKKYLNIDIGGGGGSGTTHTFGNFSGNLRYHLTVLGSEGYNLTVGTTINSGQQIDIRNKSDGLFTATSVANPATRPLNFYENGDITITGDITRTGASRSYSGLGKFGTGTLTIGGAIDVGFMRMNEGTLTSTGAMMLNILNDGNSLVDGSSIIQGNAGDDETLNLNGSFDFDVTVADEDEVNTWQVVDMATIWHVNYAVGFTVNGASSGGGAAGSRVWTFAGDTGNFKFNEANSPLSRRTL